MASAKPLKGEVTLPPLEHFEKALLWKIDEIKEGLGMNRSNTVQEVLWRGLQHMGETRGGVREEYDRRSGVSR